MPGFWSDRVSPVCPSMEDTPASHQRPARTFVPAASTSPTVSIITVFVPAGTQDTNETCAVERLHETATALARMTFTQWEWLIVCLPSLTADDSALVATLIGADPRIRAISTDAVSPAEACQIGVQSAVGRFLIQLDCGDLLEPTFVEKALWVLESQEHFAACDAYVVEFGSSPGYYSASFQEIGWSVLTERLPVGALVRRAAWDAAGGYPSSETLARAQLAFWHAFARAGLVAYTIREYLAWRRTPTASSEANAGAATPREGQAEPLTLASDVPPDHQIAHRGDVAGLAWKRSSPTDLRYDRPPFTNALMKPEGVHRILMLTANLAMGGAVRFGLDLVTLMPRQRFEFTVVITLPTRDEWTERFTDRTPDVFRLPQFLDNTDTPRFIDYLIESRRIDTILVNNSEIGYALAPYLQARHPQLAILDFCHAEEEWRDGGYPALSLAAGSAIDLRVTCTRHLKEWMCARGADPERIEVNYCGVDTAAWRRDLYDASAIRARWNLSPDLPVLLFVGRISSEKRPQVLVEILSRLVAQSCSFTALIVGNGPEEAELRQAIVASGIENQAHVLGAVPAEAVRELMAIADTLVLPSAREGLALVLYECMAMAVPPVAADVGGQAELVTPDCGYVVAPGPDEIDLYVAACMDLLQHPQQREALAAQARRRVVERFDLSQTISKMVAAVQRARSLASARSGSLVDLAAVRAQMAEKFTRLRAEELFQEAQASQNLLMEQNSMLEELRRWGADQAAAIARQEQAIATQNTMLEELRRWGADQEQLIAQQAKLLTEQAKLIAERSASSRSPGLRTALQWVHLRIRRRLP